MIFLSTEGGMKNARLLRVKLSRIYLVAMKITGCFIKHLESMLGA